MPPGLKWEIALWQLTGSRLNHFTAMHGVAALFGSTRLLVARRVGLKTELVEIGM